VRKASLVPADYAASGPELLLSVSESPRGKGESQVTVSAVQLADKQLRWKVTDVRNTEWRGPDVEELDGCVLVTNVGPGLRCFDAKTRKELWARTHEGREAIGDARRFGEWFQLERYDPGDGHRSELVEARTGKVAWTSPKNFVGLAANERSSSAGARTRPRC
jgi:hypothetical protein